MSGHCPDCGNTLCFCDKTTIFLRSKVGKLQSEIEKLKLEIMQVKADRNKAEFELAIAIEKLDRLTKQN